MSYDSIEEYHFWSWVDRYPTSGCFHRLVLGIYRRVSREYRQAERRRRASNRTVTS